MKIFDSHIHVQPWKMIRKGAMPLFGARGMDRAKVEAIMYDPEKLIAHLDEEGVDRVCIINYVAPEVMGFTEQVNAFAGRLAKLHPKRIVGFGSVHPQLTKDPAGDVHRLVEEHGIGGIKIHPSHQLFPPNAYRDGLDALRAIYETAEAIDLPVMFHTGTSVFPGARNAYADPILLDDVGVDFPKLRVILAHGGRPLWMPTALFLLRRFTHWVMDISSIPPQNLLNYFPRLDRLAGQVFFGSDWPGPGVPGMRANAEAFMKLDLPDEAKRKILFENANAYYAS